MAAATGQSQADAITAGWRSTFEREDGSERGILTIWRIVRVSPEPGFVSFVSWHRTGPRRWRQVRSGRNEVGDHGSP